MAIERHFIQEGVIRSEIESFLRNELNRAGYSGINIQKTPLSTRVILFVEKPPIVIGKKGKRINSLTRVLNDHFGIENPSIDVQKIERPTLDPNIIARRIAVALERGMNRRRIAYKAVRAVMGSGARGVEIILSGKIVGKGGRARQEKYKEGYMKNAGDSSKLVRFGSTQAYLKAGVIGVTVKIVPPQTRFPDQIEVLGPEDAQAALDEISESSEKKKKTRKKTTKKKTAKKTTKKKATKKKEEAEVPKKKEEAEVPKKKEEAEVPKKEESKASEEDVEASKKEEEAPAKEAKPEETAEGGENEQENA